MTVPSQAPSPGRVLVTDGEFKHTLGIVRALAARGHEVHVVAQSARAPSVHSRFVHTKHLAPPPAAAAYAERLLEVATSLAPVSLLPVGNRAMDAADRLRDRLAAAGVGAALPPHAAFQTANDKARTGELARAVGVHTPREHEVADLAAACAALAEFGAPLVLKSAREEGRKVVRYARSVTEAADAWRDVRARASSGVLAQEFIPGDGWGFSALYWHGKRVRSFMHRRIREWPPSGGASTCAESVRDLPALENAGTALLDALEWHGVAMVEFKGSPGSGKLARVGNSIALVGGHSLALMEVNAKFWGSHDLALAAGVDFPGDLIALLEGRELPPQDPYRPVRMSWPLGGDLWHALYQPGSLPAVLRDALSSHVAHTWRSDDSAPTWREFLQWMRSAPGAWREFRSTQR